MSIELRSTSADDGGDTFHKQLAAAEINGFLVPVGLHLELGCARGSHRRGDR